LTNNPLLIYSGRIVTVRWRSETVKREVLELLAEYPGHKQKFAAQAAEYADFGFIRNGSNGHFLDEPYDQIYEFKPTYARIFGFRRGRELIILSAATKEPNEKKQRRDYKRAENARIEYCNELNDQADGPHRS
jgi:hypothetical protein